MDIHIRTHAIEVSSDGASKARDLTRAALGRFGSTINEVHLTFRDINGPRGGIDTECLLRVTSRTGRSSVMTELGPDVWHALGGALARTKRALGRQVRREAQMARVSGSNGLVPSRWTPSRVGGAS